MASKKGKTELDEQYWMLVRRVAQNILHIRESKKLTQEDMLVLGFERRWYQRIESGTYSVSLPTLDRLARAFNVDVSVFFKKH